MRSNSDLQQVIVAVDLLTVSLLDCCEVGFRDFSHLDMLQVISQDHSIDAQASTIMLDVHRRISITITSLY